MKFIMPLLFSIVFLLLTFVCIFAQESRGQEVIMLEPSADDVPKGDVIHITDVIGGPVSIIRRPDADQVESKDGDEVLNPTQEGVQKVDRERRAREQVYEIKGDRPTPFNERSRGRDSRGSEKVPSVVQNSKTQTPAVAKSQQQDTPKSPIADSGLQKYMDSIVKKNLFMPLGSGKEAPKQVFALTGVISNTSREHKSKAIIEQVGSNTSYYVSAGETFDGDARVIEIQENSVKVVRSGEEIVLRLGTGPREGGPRPQEFSGQPMEKRQEGEATRRAEFRRRAFPASMPENIDIDKLPPFVRKMIEDRGISIEELKNNPELQEKLKNEFLQRFQEGGFPMPPVMGR